MASRTTRTTVLLTAAVAVPVLVGGAGAAYAAHYQDRALPGSTLGGVSVAGMSRQEVADLVRKRAADVTVTLDTGGVHRAAHLDDLGYTVDVDATVGAVFAANESWSSYATSLVSSREVQAVPKTDPATTAAVVSELVRTVGKAGKDARVELAPSKKSFVVVPAVSGQTVSKATFHDVVSAAARDLSSTTTTVTFVDAVPTVTTQEAEAVAARANALVATPVRVDDGEEEHAASKARKASWISIPTVDGELGSPTVKAAKVKAWVDSVVEDANSEPRAGVRNVSSTGAVRAVVTEARDGARVTNGAAVAEAAAKAPDAGSACLVGFVLLAPLVTVERLGDVDQRVVELVVARPHHRIRFGERREDGPDRLHVWCPLATEVGLPAAVVQHRPRQAVDQHRDDLVGRRARAVAADRGCDGGGMGERVAVGVAQHRPPSGDGERSLVEHLGRYTPAADNVHREPGERREPGQRRRQALATRACRTTTPRRRTDRAAPTAPGGGCRSVARASVDRAHRTRSASRATAHWCRLGPSSGCGRSLRTATQPTRPSRRPAPDVQDPGAPRALGHERSTIRDISPRVPTPCHSGREDHLVSGTRGRTT